MKNSKSLEYSVFIKAGSILLFPALFLIVLSGVGYAFTYYVNQSNPSCSDQYLNSQATNPATPFCSIARGINNSQPDDFIIVAKSLKSYCAYINITAYGITGTEGHPITLMGESDANRPLMNGSCAKNTANGIELDGESYWTFQYFNLFNYSADAMNVHAAATGTVNSRGISFKNITVNYAGWNGAGGSGDGISFHENTSGTAEWINITNVKKMGIVDINGAETNYSHIWINNEGMNTGNEGIYFSQETATITTHPIHYLYDVHVTSTRAGIRINGPHGFIADYLYTENNTGLGQIYMTADADVTVNISHWNTSRTGSEGSLYVSGGGITNVMDSKIDGQNRMNSGTTNFINVTYGSETASAIFNQMWWYQGYTGFAGSSISIYNMTTNLQQVITTDATGYTQKIPLIEFRQQGAPKVYWNNYASVYLTTTHNFNLTNTQNVQDSFFSACETNLSLGFPCVTDSFIFASPNTFYVVNSNSGSGAIVINASGSIIDCNGGGIVSGNGNNYGIQSVNRNNIIIKNCRISNYSTNYWEQGGNNVTLLSDVSINATSSSIFIAASNNVLVNMTNATNNTGSGIYFSSNFLSPNTTNITMTQSYFFGNGASGMHINSNNINRVQYLRAYNNQFINNGVGYDDYGCYECDIYNNTVSGSTTGTLIQADNVFRNGSMDSRHYNNSYSGNTIDIIFGSNIRNTSVYNNYFVTPPIFYFRFNATIGVLNFNINETTTLPLLLKYDPDTSLSNPANSIINLTYSGRKDISVTNGTVTLNYIGSNYSGYNGTSQQGLPYFQNVNSGSITVNPNEQITCGISSASGGCDYLFNNIQLNYSTKVCNLTYPLTATGTSISAVVVRYPASNSNKVIDFNGATIKSTDGNGYGIRIIDSKNFTLKNANIVGFNYGIYATSNGGYETNLSIFNTTVANSTVVNIYIANTNNTILDGVISYGSKSSHGLYMPCDTSQPSPYVNNPIIRNSIFYNNSKNGIQFNTGGLQVQNPQVYNNEIYENGQEGINDLGSANGLFYNNSIHDNGYQGILFGYYLAGGNENNGSINNQVYSNIFYNNGLTFTDAFYVGGYDIGIKNFTRNNYIYNNTYTSNHLYVYTYTQNVTFNISETLSDKLIVHFGDLSVSPMTLFYHLGAPYKHMIIINNTIQLFNLTDQPNYPCTQVFLLNGTTTPLLDACTPNGNEYNVSVTPNNRSFVFSYPDGNKWFSNVAQTINTLSYSKVGNTLTISCTGTGTIGLQNLSSLRGSYSFILHKRNGDVVDYFSTDTYNQIGCSDHTYTATNELPIAQTSPVSNVINQSILAVLVAVFMVVAVGYPVYKNYEDWTTNDWLKWLMISLIVVLFGIILLQNIFAI